MLLAAVTLLMSVSVTGTGVAAAARAGQGVGRANITTNGFTHPWMGSYLTNVGTAFCIQTGSWFPRDVGNVPYGDVPASRGVSLQNRRALSYALWHWAGTTDPNVAAGLAVVAHGLSGDSYASPDVPSMNVSDPNVKAMAVAIYNESQAKADWAAGAWNFNIDLQHQSGTTWRSVITVTSATGSRIKNAPVTLRAQNVIPSDGPIIAHPGVTDANGVITATWHQADTSQPIRVDIGADAPSYYSVWKAEPESQTIITGNGTRYSDHDSDNIPSGTGRVVKTTTNPDYQSAVGATFEVQPVGGGTALATLTVGPDGTTNAATLQPGTYQLVETSAPAGVKVDPAPHQFTITANRETSIPIVDDVVSHGQVSLLKVDQQTGEPVAGAVLSLDYDSDNNGTFETHIGDYTTTTSPITVTDLTEGNYQATEVSPPPGYLPAEVNKQIKYVKWGGGGDGAVLTVPFTFANHRTPSITTRTQFEGTPSAPVISADDLATLAGQANIVGPVGSTLRDEATVNGLAEEESATITTKLYGPFDPDAATNAGGGDGDTSMVCSDGQGGNRGFQSRASMAAPGGNLVWSDTQTIIGSGTFQSETFTPTVAGLYTYVATLTVPGVGSWSGTCGEITETAILTPTITTQAQTPKLTPGAPTADQAIITGLTPAMTADGTTTIETSLYGPFENVDALAKACKAGELGEPVGTVGDPVVHPPAASITQKSSTINLPTEDYAGVYTFIETLKVPGYPPITHECGTPPETFTVPGSPTISTVANADGAKPGSTVSDTATITGLTPAMTADGKATIETSLYGPFENADALAKACKAGELGDPIDTVTEQVEGSEKSSFTEESPGIKLPTENYVGVYTFIETLKVPGYPPITHECGTPPETFIVHDTGGSGSVGDTGGSGSLPVTGGDIALMGGLGLVLTVTGVAALSLDRRRRRV